MNRRLILVVLSLIVLAMLVIAIVPEAAAAPAGSEFTRMKPYAPGCPPVPAGKPAAPASHHFSQPARFERFSAGGSVVR